MGSSCRQLLSTNLGVLSAKAFNLITSVKNFYSASE
jgi:hypothetical protein